MFIIYFLGLSKKSENKINEALGGNVEESSMEKNNVEDNQDAIIEEVKEEK